MGPTRMLLAKPVIAAVEGYTVAGGLELTLWCDLPRTRHATGCRCVLPAVGRSPRRRWHRAPAPFDRALAHARPHPDRTRRERRRGTDVGLVNRMTDPGGTLDATARWRTSSPSSRRGACGRTGCRRTSSGAGRWTRRCASSCAARSRHSLPVRRSKVRSGSRRARAPSSRRPPPAVVVRACPTHLLRHPARTRRPTSCPVVVTARPPRNGLAIAAQRIHDKPRRSVVVIDHDGHAIGILTERDMIRLAAAGSDASSAKVRSG